MVEPLHLTGTISLIPGISGSISTANKIQGAISLADIIVSGNLNVPAATEPEHYEGDYEITPSAHHNIVLETANKKMMGDVNVLQIPYFETSNTSGYTIYIGSEV